MFYERPRTCRLRVLLFATVSAVFNVSISAQAKSNPNLLAAASLGGRTLVVELPTMNEWGGEENKMPTLEGHSSYVEHIEQAVREHWKFNERIEFRSRAECRRLFEGRSPDHLVMTRVLIDQYQNIRNSGRYLTDLLMVVRTDRTIEQDKRGEYLFKEWEFAMPLVGRVSYSDESFTASSLAFTLRQLQAYMAWCWERKSSVSYAYYAKTAATENCPQLRSRELLAVEGDFMGRMKAADLKEEYKGPLRFVSEEEFAQAYAERREGIALLYSFPYHYNQSGRAFARFVVDPSTDKILEVEDVGVKMVSAKDTYTKKLFEKLGVCE